MYSYWPILADSDQSQCINSCFMYHDLRIRCVLKALYNLFAEVLLCRQCGHSIVDGREVVDIKSALALKYKNVSVFNPKGTLVQTFQNPQGLNSRNFI